MYCIPYTICYIQFTSASQQFGLGLHLAVAGRSRQRLSASLAVLFTHGGAAAVVVYVVHVAVDPTATSENGMEDAERFRGFALERVS